MSLTYCTLRDSCQDVSEYCTHYSRVWELTSFTCRMPTRPGSCAPKDALCNLRGANVTLRRRVPDARPVVLGQLVVKPLRGLDAGRVRLGLIGRSADDAAQVAVRDVFEYRIAVRIAGDGGAASAAPAGLVVGEAGAAGRVISKSDRNRAAGPAARAAWTRPAGAATGPAVARAGRPAGAAPALGRPRVARPAIPLTAVSLGKGGAVRLRISVVGHTVSVGVRVAPASA